MHLQAGSVLVGRIAGDSPSLVASISRRFCAKATLTGMGGRSLQPPSSLTEAARSSDSGEDLRDAQAHRLGAAIDRWADGSSTLDGLEGVAAPGLSRRPRTPRDALRRYEWPCPGDLLHMDTARYARFERPGHRATGDRSQRSRNWMADGTRVGYDFAHAIVDDHSRLAYVELHSDERAQTVTEFVARALTWFEGRGITSRRLMSDNAWSYTHNRSLRELLLTREVRHLTTKPYRPQTNGKVERFHQTMRREWAYGMTYRSSHHRDEALPHWLEHYNQRRPHSGIGNRPPISRVHNLCGQDS
jgi:transposase InsO family protein